MKPSLFLSVLCFPIMLPKNKQQEYLLNFLGFLACGCMQIQRLQTGVCCVILKIPLRRPICIQRHDFCQWIPRWLAISRQFYLLKIAHRDSWESRNTVEAIVTFRLTHFSTSQVTFCISIETKHLSVRFAFQNNVFLQLQPLFSYFIFFIWNAL